MILNHSKTIRSVYIPTVLKIPQEEHSRDITRDGPIPLLTNISNTSICTKIICRYRYYTLKPRQVYYRNFIVVIHS